MFFWKKREIKPMEKRDAIIKTLGHICTGRTQVFTDEEIQIAKLGDRYEVKDAAGYTVFKYRLTDHVVEAYEPGKWEEHLLRL